MRILQDDPVDDPVGTVIAVHAFARSPEALARVAREGVGLRARVVRPGLSSMWWPTSTNNARHLDDVTDRLRDALAPGPVVILGHSAGAAAGAWIAGRLVGLDAHVTVLILVDGVESPARLIRRAWPALSDVSVRAVCAPPSRCNARGALAAWLSRQAGDVETVVVPGSGHGDLEGATSAVYRWGCGDDPGQPAGDVVRRLAHGWMAEGLAGG